MPIVADGIHRLLLDASGRPVGRYEHDERDGHVYADLFMREPGVSAEQAAEAVLADLGGMRVAGDVELGQRLLAAGGRAVRHGHVLSRDLARDPAPATWAEPPPGYRLTELDRPAADLVQTFRAAYPPGHSDHRDEPPERSLADLESFLSGREFGPMLPGSGLAVAPGGMVAGAALIGTLPGDPPAHGPWLIELFRHPAHRGVGRPLLERALALAGAAGLPALGLFVTDGNPARGLYESLGFRLVLTTLVVELPAGRTSAG